MRNLDPRRIRVHTRIIEQNLIRLEGVAGRSRADLLDDFQALDAAKYELLSAIQAMMDVLNYVCARMRLASPGNAHDCVTALARAGYFSAEHADVYNQMIGFRNILVHRYHEVDDSRVYNVLHNELDYLRDFLMDIESILKQGGTNA